MVSLLLASIGIYGVLSCSVGERSHEIGIRLALGSPRERIRRSIILRTMALALLGVAIGLVLAGGGARLIASMLFGVGRTDPSTIAVTVLIVLVVSAFAAVIPAVRASRTDAMNVLRG